MNVREQDIVEITGSVWRCILGLDAEPQDASMGDALAGERLTARVDMTGTCEGAVVIECGPSFALTAAAAMFQSFASPPCPDEVRDALGELANMVAGNIKALLPAPTQISLPLVAYANGGSQVAAGPDTVRSTWFTSCGEPFVIRLLLRNEETSVNPEANTSI